MSAARLVTLLVLLAALLAPAPRAAAATDPSEGPGIAVLVDPPSGEVGLVMALTVSISGDEGADCALIEAPDVDGGRLTLVSGPSTQQSTMIVNGRVTRSLRTEWRFQLVPERPGELVVQPFGFNCRGARAESQVVRVPVVDSVIPAGTVGLAVRASTDTVWLGQIFSIEVEASLDEAWVEDLVRGGLELDLPWLEGQPGLLRLDTPPTGGQITQVQLAGRRDSLDLRISRDDRSGRLLFRRAFRMLATHPGPIDLPAARFSAMIAAETEPDRNPFALFNQRMVVTRAVVVDARAPALRLTVRGPPEADRPPSFTNAVGRFRLTGTAAPTTLRVGDTCTLTFTLTGEGNLDFVEWPAFDELAADFRVFGKSERKLAGARVLDVQVSPKNVRVAAVPALTLASFDPEAGRYERHVVGPFPLTVSPGGTDGLVTLDDPSETLGSLETVRESLPPPAAPGWPPWLWCLPGALALLLTDLATRRARWRAANPRLLARRAARGRLQGALDQAATVRDVATAFGKFLSARLDGPPAGLPADEAATRLDPDAGELADALRRVMGGWEACYLGGAPLELDEARRQARELAARVEGRD